ncbi:Uncharacterised protein [Mycobacteroides abscessus subsp. abscessus]|nr:Uncharacterised protein [Mycobacteroides abscessus subsp. abscessus]
MQRIDEFGGCCLQPLGRIKERGKGRRPRIGGHDVVELIDDPGQLPRCVQKGRPAPLGGRSNDSEDAHRIVVTAAPVGQQDVAELADRRLKQDRGQLGVLGNHRSVDDRGARPMIDQLHRGHRENVAGHDPGGDRARNCMCQSGFQIDVNDVGPATLRRGQVVHRAHEHTLELDVGLGGQTVADVGQLGDHPDVVVESSGRFDDQGRADQRRDHGHHQATQQQLPVRRSPAVGLKGVCHADPP